MNNRRTKWLTIVLLSSLAMPAMAQEAAAPPRSDAGPGAGGPPPRRPDGPPPPRPDNAPNRPDAPGRPDSPRPPVGEASSPQVRAMMGYLQLVEQYKQLTQDPIAAGVAAVVTAGDILRPRGAQVAIDFFEKQLPQAKSLSVKNAIRLQLVDFYRASGNNDKALDHLSSLMTAE